MGIHRICNFFKILFMVRSFTECDDALLMFLVVCEKIYVSRSKC